MKLEKEGVSTLKTLSSIAQESVATRNTRQLLTSCFQQLRNSSLLLMVVRICCLYSPKDVIQQQAILGKCLKIIFKNLQSVLSLEFLLRNSQIFFPVSLSPSHHLGKEHQLLLVPMIWTLCQAHLLTLRSDLQISNLNL